MDSKLKAAVSKCHMVKLKWNKKSSRKKIQHCNYQNFSDCGILWFEKRANPQIDNLNYYVV